MLTSIVFAAFGHYVFGLAMTFTAIFLILLILVQRGKGGGLSGALGGMGGQSAFGTKAGDAFTKITIGASIVWIMLCIGAVRFLGASPGKSFETDNPKTTSGAADSGLESSSTDGGLGSTDGDLLATPDSDSGSPIDKESTSSTDDSAVGEDDNVDENSTE